MPSSCFCTGRVRGPELTLVLCRVLFFCWSYCFSAASAHAEAFRVFGQHMVAPVAVKGFDYLRLTYLS